MAAAETAKSAAGDKSIVRRTNSFVVSADRRCRRPAASEARMQCAGIMQLID